MHLHHAPLSREHIHATKHGEEKVSTLRCQFKSYPTSETRNNINMVQLINTTTNYFSQKALNQINRKYTKFLLCQRLLCLRQWNSNHRHHFRASTHTSERAHNSSTHEYPTYRSHSPTNILNSKQIETSKPSSIIIAVLIWRKATPIIYKYQDFLTDSVTATATSNENIILKTFNSYQFCQTQKNLQANKLEFFTRRESVDRSLKVVLRGISTDISTNEVKQELEQLNFEIQLIKRFDPIERSMPICLVFLTGTYAKEIYEINELFYLK